MKEEAHSVEGWARREQEVIPETLQAADNPAACRSPEPQVGLVTVSDRSCASCYILNSSAQLPAVTDPDETVYSVSFSLLKKTYCQRWN